jgi:hypothetical protein
MTPAILYEWTNKQHEMLRVPQVGNSEHKQHALSEMSHTHRDFFGFVSPPHTKGSKPPQTRSATTKLPWKLYTIPSQARLC